MFFLNFFRRKNENRKIDNKNFPAVILFPSLLGKFNFLLRRKTGASSFLYHLNNLYNIYLFSYEDMGRDIDIVDTVTPYYLSTIDKNRMTYYIPIGKFDVDRYLNNINMKKLIILNSTALPITGPYGDCTVNCKDTDFPSLLSFLSFIRYYEEDDYRRVIRYFKRGGSDFSKNIKSNLRKFYFFSSFFNPFWRSNYERELKNIEREREEEYRNLKVEFKSEIFFDCVNFIKNVIFSYLFL